MPMLGHYSSMEDRQRFVEGKPHQPTAESALAVKCPDMTKGHEQTIFYSNISFVRIAKHAVRDKMEQTAISRCPNIKRHALVRRTLPDRSSSVQLRFQVQFGTHFTPASYAWCSALFGFLPLKLRVEIRHVIRGSIPSHCVRNRRLRFVRGHHFERNSSRQRIASLSSR